MARTGSKLAYKGKRVKASIDIPRGDIKSIKDDMIKAQTLECRQFAIDALSDAYENRGFKNRKYNLADSYAARVYFNGKKQGATIYNSSEQSKGKYIDIHSGEPMDGRQAVARFFSSFKPAHSGWQVVFVAATYYASRLEMYANLSVLMSIEGKVKEAFGSKNVKISGE